MGREKDVAHVYEGRKARLGLRETTRSKVNGERLTYPLTKYL